MAKDYFIQCLLRKDNVLTSAWIEPKNIKKKVSLRTVWNGREWEWTNGWTVISCGTLPLTEITIARCNLAYRTLLPKVFKNNKQESFGSTCSEVNK